MYIVNPLYLPDNDASGYIEEKMKRETRFLMILLMKTKGYQKNTQMLGMKLKTKSK